MLDELCDKVLLGKLDLDTLKTKALQISLDYDYATAIAWTVANKNTNNDLGKVGEYLANNHFGWKRSNSDSDSDSTTWRVELQTAIEIEIKTSAPPKGAYRIGQIKKNYDLTQTLFCQFFHFQTKDMQFYIIPTIEEFLLEFDQWIGNDQGNDFNIVGIRSIPHNKPCWNHLQKYRKSYSDIKNLL